MSRNSAFETILPGSAWRRSVVTMARHAFVGVPIEYSSSMSMPSKPEPVDRGDELVDEPLRRLLIRELGPSGVRPVVDDGQKHRDPQALQLFHIVGVIERGIDRQREGEHRDVGGPSRFAAKTATKSKNWRPSAR